jgi:hypothetical protein
MSDVITLSIEDWDQKATAAEQALAVEALEWGSVLCLPHLSFPMHEGDDQFLSPSIAGEGKNISLDPSTGLLRGSNLRDAQLQRLTDMVMRFSTSTHALLANLLPGYVSKLQQGRTSYRPTEIAGRQTSWRKDDTRLHVDSFPSSPTQGDRILRVFTNLHPQGRARHWRLGESFEGVARRFLPSAPAPLWGSDRLLEMLRITKRRRTAYDHYMLQLHDRMKADMTYQEKVTQVGHEFEAGSTWIVFTDLVSHAAMSGQYALEQTYYLPVSAMRDPSRSPLRVLENLLGRTLA